MSRETKGRNSISQLRIIGGQWRGRKLTFTPVEGLRPTTDRVRETLFNWLAQDIHDANCLDVFAGSGALGLEALSRGAGHCDFIDTSSVALQQLSKHLQTLDACGRSHCHAVSALTFLEQPHRPWNIVFIDPPFGQNLVAPVCELLTQHNVLSPDALVYVETGVKEDAPNLPENWQLHREKKAGGVSYRLFIVHAE